MTTAQRHIVPPLQPHLGRIVEAILHLVAEAAERKIALTQYDIVKSIFLADRAHLNKYGRPITYDNYVAMENGPVPSATYYVLQERPAVLKRIGSKLPWTRRAAPEISRRSYAYERPARAVNDDVLSPSDLTELSNALATVNLLGFSQIKKLTHEDRAYKQAWKRDGGRRYPMNYALLFEEPSPDRAAELSFLSKHI